jgi:hypothetical protein
MKTGSTMSDRPEVKGFTIEAALLKRLLESIALSISMTLVAQLNISGACLGINRKPVSNYRIHFLQSASTMTSRQLSS